MMIVLNTAPTNNEPVVDVEDGANDETPGVELKETTTTAILEESIDEFVHEFNDIVLEAGFLSNKPRINKSTPTKRSGKQLQTKRMVGKNIITVLVP